VPEQRGDRFEPHAAVYGLGGQGVPQPVRVHAGHSGGAAHATVRSTMKRFSGPR
jgi:hypothetical protein